MVAIPGSRPSALAPAALLAAVTAAVTVTVALPVLVIAPAVQARQGAAGLPQAGVHPAAHASRAVPSGLAAEVPLDGPALADVPPGGFPTTGYAFGQCTWWVAYNRQVPSNMGDAWRWLASAVAHGYQTSGQPVVGSIVVYRAGLWSDLGHVAIVIAVGADHFDVSEMNVLATGEGTGRLDERRNAWPDPGQAVEGFIL